MKFKKIKIENYKSFQYPVSIEFPESKNGKSIFLIGGMNGAGKSSIMESINICLYGDKPEVIFKNINRKEAAKGNCSVSFELTMETEDSEEIIIKRSWSAGTVDQPKVKDLEEKLVVVRNGKRIIVQDKDSWQEIINATIPHQITQFFFFDGEKIQHIAADDHSEVKLKNSLEAALGIQYLSRLASDITKIKLDEKKSFIEISDEDIEFKESEIKKENAKLNKKKTERAEIDSELKNFRTKCEKIKNKFMLMFNKEPEKAEERKTKERRKIQISNIIGQLENQIKTLMEKFLPWALAGQLFPAIKKQLEQERDLAASKTFKENAFELAENIIKVVDNPEPIYDKILNENQKAKLRSRIISLYENENSETTILNLSDREAAKLLNMIEEIENSDLYQLGELFAEKEELVIEMKELSIDYSDFISDSEKQLFEEMQAEMESLQNQIGKQSIRLSNIDEEISSIERKVKELNSELEKLYDKYDVSKEKRDFLNECDTIASLLNNYIVKLRKNKIHLLQEKTLEMYKLLSSKSGLIKDLEIDENSYEIVIRDRSGHIMKKSGLSAGEKEIFAVSLLWGLAQTSQLNLPILIDTPLSRLDSVHRNNIINNYFPNAAEQVIILSTDTEIDKDYYKVLESSLSGAGKLVFDQTNEITQYKQGYFWN